MRSRVLFAVSAFVAALNMWASGPAQAGGYCHCVDHDCRRQWCVKDLLP